jgi:hypothetical protein
VTYLEMVGRISDLETALRLVIIAWVVTVVVLGKIPDHDCPHCPHCQGLAKLPRCPMCLQKHDPTERCG